MIARVGERREATEGRASGERMPYAGVPTRAWNGRASAVVALIVAATCLASGVHYATEINHPGFLIGAGPA